MYVPMKIVLDDARRNNYAVIAANAVNLELVRGILSAAVELDSPIIVNIGPGQMSGHGDGRVIQSMVREFASRTHVPIALNLDHGKTPRAISFAFRNGFSSIMIDCSEFPYEENARRTREVVELAHLEGVSVEGEIGHVGAADQDDHHRDDMYTKPEDAKRFVEDTGVDALAVAFGTAHGRYPKGFVPKLDFERLRAIRAAVDVPLVMHGGSSSGDDNIREAVASGINKINVCTDTFVACRDAAARALRDEPDIDYIKLLKAMERAAKDTIASYIRLAGSANRASAFGPLPDAHAVFSLDGAKSAE